MELLLELFLTISLSLVFTSLFIKLFSMNSGFADENDQFFTEEITQMDKFEWVPFKNEVVKVKECEDEGKSMVEFHKGVGVELEEKISDVEVVDDHGKKCEEMSFEDENNIDHEGGNQQGDMKMCEIEIECESENENEEIIIDDWEKIGRKDFEEILGNNKVGLHEFDANLGGLGEFDVVVHGK